MVSQTEISDAGKSTKLKEYIDSGACVKALVDSGITKLPQKFIYPQKFLAQPSDNSIQLPEIDLTGIQDPHRREKVVAGIRDAGENWGFFQLVNHGVPNSVMEEMLESIRRYNEQPTEAKMEWRSRDKVGTFEYFHKNMPALPWRDSISIEFHEDGRVEEEATHPIFIKAANDYVKYCITPLKKILFELVAEALELKKDYFANKSLNKTCVMTTHYYPPCSEPELTMGGVSHTDLGCMTLLLQDNSGGFQIFHGNQWLDVPPVSGALLVNFGDFMQLMTNGKFISARHRILATRGASPRISLATFINPANSVYDKIIGPIEELLSEENPPIYKPTTGSEYRDHFLLQTAKDSTIQTITHFTISS